MRYLNLSNVGEGVQRGCDFVDDTVVNEAWSPEDHFIFVLVYNESFLISTQRTDALGMHTRFYKRTLTYLYNPLSHHLSTSI